jgi:hypothetical protein
MNNVIYIYNEHIYILKIIIIENSIYIYIPDINI